MVRFVQGFTAPPHDEMTDPSTNPVPGAAAPAAVSVGDRVSQRLHIAEGIRPMVLFVWAAVVGSLVGLAGGVFQWSLSAIALWRGEWLTYYGTQPVVWWLVPMAISAVVVFGALWLVRTLAPETSGSGVQEIEGALDGLRPLRWLRVLPVKFVAGMLSLGSGMVLGREGPTIQIGGNVGKMVADLFKLSRDDVHTLVAAGAGAGLSAAFNAPLAGILFVIEEMRPQFKYSFLSVHSVLIAAATADVVVRLMVGQDPDIQMADAPRPPLASLWLFPLLGIAFGALGALFNGLLVTALNFFAGLKGAAYHSIGLLVGAGIGLLGILFPLSVGGGYEVIPAALENSLATSTLLALFVARFATTMVSYGSGAPGGIFAPMLALATLFGMWSGHFAHAWFPDLITHPQIFAVAGMGALFSATVRAPLTGIALTIEMTGNYSLILPLIVTCMVAAIVAQALHGQPIYSVLLKRTLAKNAK
jgi:CIC family chloride channel protein